MADSSNRTLVCSIVFLDIVGYSKKSVDEQLSLKQAFNDIVGRGLKPVAVRDRIVLDTGDGAAITFLGDPEDALFIAMEMRDAMTAHGALPTRMGVNLGPVRLIRDINKQLNIVGDGINVAQRVMGFANTGQLLVSRSFHEVVSCLSPDYAGLFVHMGARTDKHVREHDVYAVGTGRRASRLSGEVSGGDTRRRLLSALFAPGPLGVRRFAYALAPLVFALAWGATALVQTKPAPEVSAPKALPATASKPAAGKLVPSAAKAVPPVPKQAQALAAAPTPVAPVAKAAPGQAKPIPAPVPAAGTGKVEFLIIPFGEVWIDGRNHGMSPPLQSVDLPAGEHLIEFRYSTFKPHSERVDVRPGTPLRVVHRFKG